MFLAATVHLVEGVEAGRRSRLKRRRRAGNVRVGGLIDHLRRTKEGSILKSVEMVDELKRAVKLVQGGRVNDGVERKEDGEVGDALCLIPPSMKPSSGLLRATHDVDDSLHEEGIG